MARQYHNVDLDATATRDFPLFVAMQDGFLRAAFFSQELDTDGDKVIKIRNLTTSVDLTNNLDIDALAADASAAFVLATTNVPWKKGDVIGLVYTVATAGAVAPGEVAISMLVDDPIGSGSGPGWAG